jgi:hypothetical protein
MPYAFAACRLPLVGSRILPPIRKKMPPFFLFSIKMRKFAA